MVCANIQGPPVGVYQAIELPPKPLLNGIGTAVYLTRGEGTTVRRVAAGIAAGETPAAICLGIRSIYFFDSWLISRRRPRLTCSGGAGMEISSTPLRKVALAWSVIAPSGSATTRRKLPELRSMR